VTKHQQPQRPQSPESRAGGLTTIHSGRPLPDGTPSGSIIGTTAGGRLHLFVTTPRIESYHLALDANGDLAEPPTGTSLPPVHSLAAASNALLVTCAGEYDGRAGPVLARLDLTGSPTDRCDLPITGTVTQWPKIAASSQTAWCTWTTIRNAPRTSPVPSISDALARGGASDRVGEAWWIASWAPRSEFGLHPVVEELAGVDGDEVMDLAVTAEGKRVLAVGLLGGTGRAGRIGVRVLESGKQTAAGDVPDVGNPAFLRAYAGPGGWWILWKERAGGVLLARRLRYGVEPGVAGAWEPPLRLYKTDRPERVYDAHLIIDQAGGRAGDTAAVALLVRVAAAGGGGVGSRFRDLVALLLPRDGTGAGYRELDEPGTGWSASGWLAGRLVLIHGSTSPRVTVLAPSASR
jgi:hypothetical protein